MITNTKLDPIETASVDELQALQTQRLKWTLKHAYENVPMYRRKFDAAGVHPDDFRELSDLRKFPFTTKQDLRDNYPFDTFAVPMEQVSPGKFMIVQCTIKSEKKQRMNCIPRQKML